MQTSSRVIRLTIVLLIALFSFSCGLFQKNTNQRNANASAPKPARWVAQYRSPLSTGITGNDLPANFFYSSISVISSSVVYVAGDMLNPKTQDGRVGIIVHTTDGGQHWTETILEQPNMMVDAMNAVHFINAEEGWTVGVDTGQLGIMFKTADGGKTWEFLRLSAKQSPTSIFFADSNTGWMGGSNPRPDGDADTGGPSDILGTTDGGRTWSSQMRVPVSIYDIFFIDKMTGWAAGSKGAIYHTTDGGRTWNSQRSELELGDGPTVLSSEGSKLFKIYGIHFVNAQTGYAVAAAEEETTGRVLGTTNGGETWAKQRIVGDAGARDVMFVNPNEGWILTDRGQYIYHTLDVNRTWLAEPRVFEQDVQQVRLGAADSSHVWAVGGGAIFFRVSD
ncbi:MAG TPA: YCF48-related protein [Blastocatellia bacterium]|nr:YCF48-related protein [Blastocatellia bacterium]